MSNDEKYKRWKLRSGASSRALKFKRAFTIMYIFVELAAVLMSGREAFLFALVMLGIPVAYMLEYIRLTDVNRLLVKELEELKAK